ncbi:hypothetical protein [Gordonia alkanivorans]|uniref:hypothetical protein n=1 Tax=Gordonia alkanivorans TaxID=84096 RepID=UPI0004B125CD|nr:hypothetical protein [Gordonia alkanivorans]
MLMYTTTQAAEVIADGLAEGGRRPTVHANKVKTLVRANRLSNHSGHSRVMLDPDEVAAFIRDTRYVTAAELLSLHELVYRVSVLERTDTPRVTYDDDGHLLRTHRGVDFSDNPDSQIELGGWEGVWPIREKKAIELADENGLLLASARGYVGPGHLRPVKSLSRCTPRWYLHTSPPSAEIEEFVGTGLWIDVPDGPISDFVRVP